MTKNQNSKPYQ